MLKYLPHLLSASDDEKAPRVFPAGSEENIAENPPDAQITPLPFQAPLVNPQVANAPQFKFDLPNGGWKIIRKSVADGVPKYLIEGPTGTDWVSATELPADVPKAYELAYRRFRRMVRNRI